MENTSMKYNASGYYDETPYKAYQNMNTPKPGEIWETSLGKEYLILKNRGGFSTVLSLSENNRNNECIGIISREQKYTNPAMVQYVFNSAFSQFIKAIPDDKYLDIMGMVADSLEVKINVIANKEENDAEFKVLQDKCRELNQKIYDLETELKKCEWENALKENENITLKIKLDSIENDYAKNNQVNSIEVAKAQTETEVMKRMYNSLLDRFLAKGELE